MTGRPASRSVVDVRSTLVSAAGSGGLRVRLVRAADDADYPFVRVHEGRFARILLAELVGDDDRALVRFAWKLRVDEVAASAIASRALPGNGELDRRWRQERAELTRVHSPHVVAPVAVPAALTQSPPVFYCQRVDRYFHPVCPQTRKVLTVCRDDSVLLGAGLPDYEHDTVRYLHNRRAGHAQTFYRVGSEAPAAPRSGVRIGSQRDLIRDWSGVVHADDDVNLPCRTCSHRSDCYPEQAPPEQAIPAERYLHAVSFYDVDALALELATVDFDTAMVRLGGGELDDFDASQAWLGGGDIRQRALEVLRLKLAAFADVCRGVSDLHESGRPHLGVSPANIVAFDGTASSALPANWHLRFALAGLGGATPIAVPGAAGETMWQPGREVSEDELSRLFLSPALRSLEGGTVTMSVACRSSANDAGGEQVVFDVHRAGVPPFVMPGDLLIVRPGGHGDGFCARVEDVSTRGLMASLLPDQEERGDTLVGTSFDARLSFVRRSGPSADLYGLGMLLLRMLLVHDEQGLPEVAATVERCLARMTSMTAQAANDGDGLADCWQQILDGDDGEGRFASWSVMEHRVGRQTVFDAELQGREIVPKVVWHQLMALAGRLLLAPPIARASEDGIEAQPIRGVLAALRQVERRINVELFDREGRDQAIRQACSQYAVLLRADRASDADTVATIKVGEAPESGDGDGFVLAVGRVGESAIEQHHFEQDRVTIGRREGDNMLLLADPMVSSNHAVIEFSEGEFVLFDRGSTNGTEVDGIRLPIEVPHPLDDGSVIHIRPFVLSFRRAGAVADGAPVVPPIRLDELLESLCAAYAEHAGGGAQALHAGFLDEFEQLRSTMGRPALIELLGECERLFAEPRADVVPPSIAADSQDALAQGALRAWKQLSRNLIGSSDVESPQQLQEFAGRVQRFVEVTSRWIEDTLQWRNVLGSQLDLRATSTGTGSGRPPLRSAAEVRSEVLKPTGDDPAATDYFLGRFFDDVLVILEGLLEGNQQVRRAIRERLDPLTLIETAGREAKLRILVQAASNSVLWKLYTDTFAELTAGGGEQEEQLQRLLERARSRRRSR